MTAKLDGWPERVAAIELRRYTELAFGQLERRIVDGFARLERKVDQFIDSQSQHGPRSKSRRRKR
jgi:hypothetical protein